MSNLATSPFQPSHWVTLQRRGYDIVVAGDGQRGVEMAKSEKPDLVLMDMNMPILDGWRASQMIRTDPYTEQLPIIGLTVHALEGDREKALQAGCSDYHTKPVEFAQLMTQIETLIRKCRAASLRWRQIEHQ